MKHFVPKCPSKNAIQVTMLFGTILILAVSLSPKSAVAELAARVTLNWSRTLAESKTLVSMEVCVEPPMRRGSPIHDQLYQAIRQLKADYVRFSPWDPYPKLAVAELDAPAGGKTSWDFSLLDPLVDRLHAGDGGARGGDEHQHDSRVDVQDGEAGGLSRKSGRNHL